MKKVFRRPSPAMVVAIVALIAALGGTAVAGGALNKKKVNNIISNRAPSLSVASAKNADSATTANSAKNVFFAQVAYTTATPSVTSGTPGISGAGESFLGAANLTFPRNMTGCAVTAVPFNGGGTEGYARESTLGTGSTVVIKLTNSAGADFRTNFNVVAVCP